MLKIATTVLFVCLLSTSLLAVDVQLKGADKDMDVDLISLVDGQVTYKKGRKEATVNIDDFLPTSALIIKKHFSARDADSRLDVARFAMHRGLFAEAREEARKVGTDFESHTARAERLAESARILQADAKLQLAVEALDEKDVEKARPLLEEIISDFPDTPAQAKADILLGTLKRVELEVRAAELEKEAKAAQREADEEEGKRRKGIDEWLDTKEAEVAELAALKKEADENGLARQVHLALPKYEDVTESLEELRETLEANRNVLKFRGQPEQADRIEETARLLMIEAYYKWGFYLYDSGRYRTAAAICNLAIKMDPKDRRLLSLKVDIDEVYDPLDE